VRKATGGTPAQHQTHGPAGQPAGQALVVTIVTHAHVMVSMNLALA
jgi:hypothetical protein